MAGSLSSIVEGIGWGRSTDRRHNLTSGVRTFNPPEVTLPQALSASPVSSPAGHRYWRDSVAGHERPSVGLGIRDLATSAVPYLLLTVAMYLCLDVSVWLTLALAVPAAGFLLRTFIVFHDCTHGSFLPSRRGEPLGRPARRPARLPALRATGATTTPSTTAPPATSTAAAPATSLTLTVEEYVTRPWKGAARLPALPQPAGHVRARPDLVADDRAPALEQRYAPTPAPQRAWRRTSPSRLLIAADRLARRLEAWLLVQMPTAILAGTAGVFMFYVQHQFEDVYWEDSERVGSTPTRRCREAPT